MKAVQCAAIQLMFRTNISPSSSWSKNQLSKKLAWKRVASTAVDFEGSTRCYNIERFIKVLNVEYEQYSLPVHRLKVKKVQLSL
jgi:hypothetical protein